MAHNYGSMRTNGCIYWMLSPAEPVLNEYGEAVASSVSWSRATPCYINELTRNNKASYEDGKYTQVSYEVLVEPLYYKPSERVRIVRNGCELGEFSVVSHRSVSLDRIVLIL